MLEYIITNMKKIIFLILILTNLALSATIKKRSIQPGTTGAIASNSGGTISLSISGTTATFSSAMPDTFGIGDAIVYNTVASICFVYERINNTTYTVKNSSNGTPTSIITDVGWEAFRSYTSMANAASQTENTGINIAVRNFDTSLQSLITSDEERHWICYRGTDGTTVSLNGLDGNSTHQLLIYTPCANNEVGTSLRPQGKFTTSSYFLSTSNTTGSLTINTVSGNQYYIKFKGIQIKNTVGDGLHDGQGSAGTASNMFFDSCIFIGSNNSSTQASHSGIDISATKSVTYYISNSLFYQWNSTAVSNNNAGVHINNSGVTVYIYNSQAWKNDRGFTIVSGTGTAKNCIVNGFASATYLGTWQAASTNNVDNRSLAPGSNARNGQMPAYVDSTNFDFHIVSSDTVAKNTGVDNSADANLPFNNDTDGHIRVGTWDRGFHEFGATGNCDVAIQNRKRGKIISIY